MGQHFVNIGSIIEGILFLHNIMATPNSLRKPRIFLCIAYVALFRPGILNEVMYFKHYKEYLSLGTGKLERERELSKLLP